MRKRNAQDHPIREKIDGGPDPVNIHVGARIRLRRTLLNMSKSQFGKALGLTFQQVQKYEHGTNRIAASRLWDISATLDVPVSFFFDGLSQDSIPERTGKVFVTDPMRDPATHDLIITFHRISNPAMRRAFLRLICAAGRSEEPA